MDQTFEEFLTTICAELGIRPILAIPQDYSKPAMGNFITKSWIVGGEGGGSCWDDGTDDHHHSVKAQSEPDFVELDVILEHFVPKLSFQQYKRLDRELVKTREYSENEYYGNYYNYRMGYVCLQELYNYLREHAIS